MISNIKSGLFAFIVGVCAVSVSAQEIDPVDVYQDPNGIDLVSNDVSTPQLPELSIPAAPELTFRDLADFIPLLEIVTGDTSTTGFDPNIYTVSAGRVSSDVFAQCGNEMCYASNGTGGMLFNAEGGDDSPNVDPMCSGPACPPPLDNPPPQAGDVLGLGGVTYRAGDTGMMMTFMLETGRASGTLPQPVKKFLAQEITMPGGADLQIEYEAKWIGGIEYHRPVIVTSTSGFQLRFSYFSNSANLSWGSLQKAEIVQVTNPAVALASLSYSGNTVTDVAGRVFHCVCMPDIYPTRPEHRGSRMKLPGESNYSFETFRLQSSNTRTVTVDGMNYTYVSTPDNNWPQPPGSPWPVRAIHDITITGPDGFYQFIDVTNIQATTGEFDPPRRRIDSVTDSLGNTTTYQYTGANRLSGATYPEGNSVSMTYDLRGNILTRTDTPKPSSSLQPITQTAAHPTTGCGIIGFNCYQPIWTEDGEGNRTDFTWNTWGLLVTQLDPPDENNRRRKVKNTWSGSGPIAGEICPQFLQLGLPGPARCTPRLLREEICETDANGNEITCGTANSFVREFTYSSATSLPTSETITDGAGNAPLTTTYTYDAAGRQLSVDGPLPGSDDATYARYDALGRMIWEIGALGENGRRLATKTEYRISDDQVDRVLTGTVPGSTTATSPGAPSLLVISDTDTQYNSRRLPTKNVVRSASGAMQSVTQISYDGMNRSKCTAVRMNLSSLPSDACSIGTPNSNGERDRITRQHYDTESRVVRIEQGLGTDLRRDYATYTFTPNGQTSSMTDARGFKASMLYDGFDRQSHWYFPNPNVTGAINPSDYELYAYDKNGNQTSIRKRDGSVITYQYDSLDRLIKKTVPARAGLNSIHTRDVYYDYDIRGLQSHARFDSDSGVGTASNYDRYGRLTATTDNTGSGGSRTLNYTYNAAGSRTSISHSWDNATFTYTYSSGGLFNQLKGPWGAVLVDYQYNTDGELSSAIKYSSAPDQSWTYDPIGRMASNTINGPGSTYDVTWSFTRNPASQIKTETQSNDAYSWDGFQQFDRSYTTNGLNQYTNVSGQSYCYDANGNLTLDGTYVYKYDVENRLVEMRAKANSNCAALSYSGQKKAELRYDPLGRLYEVTNYVSGVSQGPVRFLHDGDALVAEFDANGAVLARHLHGPNQGIDDPLVSYDGPSAGYPYARFLQADARGSIVYRSDQNDANRTVNTYDEYGQPGSGNTGRHQYTGQVWLSELGMYYFKARIYSPKLGRFMQTDPIGYEGGNNIYSYANADPINFLDQTGLDPDELFDTYEEATEDWAEYVQTDGALDSEGNEIEINNYEYSSPIVRTEDSDGNESFLYRTPQKGERNTFTLVIDAGDVENTVGSIHNHNAPTTLTADEGDEQGQPSEADPFRRGSSRGGQGSRGDDRAARAIARASPQVGRNTVRTSILGPRQRMRDGSPPGRVLRHFIGNRMRPMQ